MSQASTPPAPALPPTRPIRFVHRGQMVEVDGVGEGNEVQERLIKEIDGRFHHDADRRELHRLMDEWDRDHSLTWRDKFGSLGLLVAIVTFFGWLVRLR